MTTPTLEEMLAQNDALREQLRANAAGSPMGDSGKTKMYVIAVLVLAIVCVAAVAILAILRPGEIAPGTLIIGVLLPVITAFLGAALREVHTAVNGRLSQLLDTTARAAKSEGMLERRAVDRSPMVPPIVPGE